MCNKYGYCKFKEGCKRTHYKENCACSEGCKGAKVCHKRHLKACKRYISNYGCQFGSDCVYKHTSKSINSPDNDMAKKVELLETLVIEVGNTIIKLEAEIKDIKRSKSNHT